MRPDEFVHLRVHSEFSVADGLVRHHALVQAARTDGQFAVAVADDANLFGALRFYKQARANGLKAIIGADMRVLGLGGEPHRLLLLAKCNQGYRRLCDLLTRAWLRPQSQCAGAIDWDWLKCEHDLIALCGFADGVIGTSLLQDDVDSARYWAGQLKSRFPSGFYMEVQRFSEESERLTSMQVELAQDLGIPLVATHPVLFMSEQDHLAQDAKSCIASGQTLGALGRHVKFSKSQHFRTREQMRQCFSDLPDALANTAQVARQCNFEFSLGSPQLPVFPTPDGVTQDEHLYKMSRTGLNRRLRDLFPDETQRLERKGRYEERLELELKTIVSMGFSGYFLIVADFIDWAKHNGVPVGPGRGSGAGSLVAYGLGITDIDPLSYDLLFERFLNPERVSMPDFDVDFCPSGRDRVIDYVRTKYGLQSVSQIATFGTLAARAVIKDVGRVMSLSYGLCDSLAKLIPNSPADPWSLERVMREEPAFARKIEEEGASSLLEVALKLEGVVRNVGMHAGGVVIAPGRLANFCALYRSSIDSPVISQFDKDDIEAVGLVKFDFLGLRNLTVIDKALKLINRDLSESNGMGPSVSLDKLDLNDPRVLSLFGSGQTTAVFQSESRSAKDLGMRLQPDCFEDVIALMALNRPGPLGSGMVDDFIERKKHIRTHGKADPSWYFHPSLEDVLRPTYGVIVYQEQVMLVAQILAGYSLGGADLLRRAMGKKKPDEMAKQRRVFIDGATQRGVSLMLAGQLFDLMEKFAEYGFNKSHSAAYALIAYQTAWLKVYYPAQFMAAALSCEAGDTDGVKLLCDDARQVCSLVIEPPCVNSSNYEFTPSRGVTGTSIRYGIGAIKGVGEPSARRIEEVRSMGGPFVSIMDFVSRVGRKFAGKRPLEQLIRSGAFDTLHPCRASLMESVSSLLEWASELEKIKQQSSLMEGVELRPPALAKAKAWSLPRKLEEEKYALGHHLSGGIFDAYASVVAPYVQKPLSQLKPDRKAIWTAAAISSVKYKTTRNGKMAILALEDSNAKIEAVVYSETLEGVGYLLKDDSVLIFKGKPYVDKYTSNMRLMVERVLDLELAQSEFDGRVTR